MAASDNLGGQFDFSREINKQVIPKAHHDAILNALQYYGEEGVELMPHGIAFHKDGKRHIVPSGFTDLHVIEKSHPTNSSFFGFVPNESQQNVFATEEVSYGSGEPGLTHPRWEAPVFTYQNRKWDEGPEYVDQGEHRQVTDPSKMKEYLRHHSFIGEGDGGLHRGHRGGTFGWGRHLMAGNRKPDSRVRVTVYKDGTSRWNQGEVSGYYHYHPGTGAITRREPDNRDDY